ncbi:hypothetical protein ACIQNU_00730 [Streptomyces sp. NPDC091292]|uniref:hypothetical protein n=1 Tax=Streptomyces sp. NPDC091292 TaxID=3365991 RepID=UPI003817DB12
MGRTPQHPPIAAELSATLVVHAGVSVKGAAFWQDILDTSVRRWADEFRDELARDILNAHAENARLKAALSEAHFELRELRAGEARPDESGAVP